MKILIISDIHGNLEALQTVLAESHDELWVLGDLVNYGPSPREVVNLVRRHASLVIQGNHDFAIGNGAGPQCSRPFREMARAMREYTASMLDAQQTEYLRNLPRTAERTVGGCRFFLCHATPADPLFHYCPANAERWAVEVAGVEADVVLTGHTHLPSLLTLTAQQIVNPGSVGQPKHGTPMACYALWEDGKVCLGARPYQVEETVEKVLSLPVSTEIRSQLAAVLRSGCLPA